MQYMGMGEYIGSTYGDYLEMGLLKFAKWLAQAFRGTRESKIRCLVNTQFHHLVVDESSDEGVLVDVQCLQSLPPVFDLLGELDDALVQACNVHVVVIENTEASWDQ